MGSRGCYLQDCSGDQAGPLLMLCPVRQLETGHWKYRWSSYNPRVN